MSRVKLDAMLAEIRATREATLQELVDVAESEFLYPTDMVRWTEIRRILLRFGDHMQEHTTQIEGVRADIERDPTMAQRMLGRAEIAWGRLLSSTVGLTDEDLDVTPPDGGWSVWQVLEHLLEGEQGYLESIRKSRAAHNQD